MNHLSKFEEHIFSNNRDIVKCQTFRTTMTIKIKTKAIPGHPMTISHCFLHFLPNDKFFNRSKLKALAENKISVTENLKLVLGRVENIMGKRRKCWLQHFLLFPMMFSKGPFERLVKSLN